MTQPFVMPASRDEKYVPPVPVSRRVLPSGSQSTPRDPQTPISAVPATVPSRSMPTAPAEVAPGGSGSTVGRARLPAQTTALPESLPDR
ncbi:hypothetical protein [Actinoplanes sp. NPDC051494]|uniref:hypothetical protein n=1 Tax=Actinoplanes sp. NPDC051494 TaxID=3363907 RepID=UPI0037B1AC5B